MDTTSRERSKRSVVTLYALAASALRGDREGIDALSADLPAAADLAESLAVSVSEALVTSAQRLGVEPLELVARERSHLLGGAVDEAPMVSHLLLEAVRAFTVNDLAATHQAALSATRLGTPHSLALASGHILARAWSLRARATGYPAELLAERLCLAAAAY